MAQTRQSKLEGQRRQRQRYKEAGLVQVNFWVPLKARPLILQAARAARNKHLSEGGWIEKWVGEGLYDGRDK